MRIDEILLWDGLVTEEQVKTALQYQREHGGRLGSHLVRLGFVDEAGLLTALSKQFGCESVMLSDVEIPREITQLIPSNLAIARTVIPFDYDPDDNLLKIACENPDDENLINELNFMAAGKKVKLYVAAEMPLRAAVARHYVGVQRNADPEEPAIQQRIPSLDDTGAVDILPSRGSILLVSDEPDADRPLREALENENYKLVCTNSADDAIEIIGNQRFHTVFIRDTVQGDYIDLIDRLRKVSPRTCVRYYESPAQLLLSGGQSEILNDQVIKSLEVFTSLLASRENLKDNHAGVVGHYVDRLCRQMGIPDRDRLSIVNAAYLHNMSRFYYGEAEEASDCRTRIALTAKLLDSLNYSPLVVEILRSAYINLQQKYTKRLPIETLGGNILTIVDIFCENMSFEEQISLDKFEAVRSNLISMTGKLFLPEVVETFIEMIEDEILIEPSANKYNQALVMGEDLEQLNPIVKRLRQEGFRPIALSNTDRLVELYQRSRPDYIILAGQSRASRAIAQIDELTRRGVEIVKVPTFLLTSQRAAAELASMFERGIEDIIPIENGLDLLVMKMRKLRSRAETNARGESVSATGTAGLLEDMNLIDLLQALGPSRKTAKISITSNGNELILYLKKGQIVFAQSGDLLGAEGVYAALAWNSGKWVIEPVAEEDIPPANNEYSNESILMEGCRLLDECQRETST